MEIPIDEYITLLKQKWIWGMLDYRPHSYRYRTGKIY